MMQAFPLIFLPGLGTSPRSYASLLPALWRHGSVTLVNHGGQDAIEAMAREILAQAPPRFALAGHSMGGYIAFEILRQAPERVAKLALLNSSARPDTEEGAQKRKGQMEKVRQGRFAEVIEAALPAFVHPNHQGDAKLREIITKAHEDAGAEAYIRQQTAILTRKDSRPGLRGITQPTLVLTGDADKLIPREMSDEIAAAVPNAKLVVVKQAGHMAALEQPEAVGRGLGEWLAA